jgi:hypothetical protein
MPVISMFYGIIICMYFFDTGKHKKPHIHVKYQGEEVIISIPEGEVLEGKIQKSKMKLVAAWIEIHRDELMADWELSLNGQEIFKIEPLK